MTIRWTTKARSSYFEVLYYLEKAWTDKEIKNFISKVDQLLNQIEQNPEMFEESATKKNIRKGFISRYYTLYYRVKPRSKEVQLLVFWDNRMNPEKLDY
jgi:plasmid stabilization system protein ParE